MIERLTKTYADGTHAPADDLPCGENSREYKHMLIEKLGKYEDTDAFIKSVLANMEEILLVVHNMIKMIKRGE